MQNSEVKNEVLLQSYKAIMQSGGMDMKNVSFGFYDKITLSEILQMPFTAAIVFADAITMQVIKESGKTIHVLPSLYTLALNVEIQNKEFKAAIKHHASKV